MIMSMFPVYLNWVLSPTILIYAYASTRILCKIPSHFTLCTDISCLSNYQKGREWLMVKELDALGSSEHTYPYVALRLDGRTVTLLFILCFGYLV
ncbi:hypothetical protein VNO78_20306 [Psophocarpus tetragonolobus]|uniref:Uncharacterized protein n=1 Tax=Psophocarpus tetragonolobus TaxID=3891 RepID=A0AAN9XHD5_PSOTE